MIAFDVKQMEYFVQAARAGSISKAAKQALVSQQALSHSIRTLERSLGIALFERGPTGVVLTEGGAVFLAHAENALDALNRCEESIAPYRRGVRETVRVGISPLCFDERGGTLDALKLAAFQHQHEEVDFVFEEVPLERLALGVLERTIGFGIAPVNKENDIFETVDLALYQTAVIMSKKNPLQAHDTVSLSDLTTGNVVMAHGSPDADHLLASFFDQTRDRLHLAPVQVEYADASKLVVDDSTFVIRPMQHALRTTSTKHAAVRPLVDDEGRAVVVLLNLFWRRDRVLTTAEQSLVAFIRKLYRMTH